MSKNSQQSNNFQGKEKKDGIYSIGIWHMERKNDFLTQKQLRENELSQYAKEEHQLSMKHKQELHNQELEFKKKMYDLILEKCKYEAEKAKIDLNKASTS